jgi:hypothetical protein
MPNISKTGAGRRCPGVSGIRRCRGVACICQGRSCRPSRAACADPSTDTTLTIPGYGTLVKKFFRPSHGFRTNDVLLRYLIDKWDLRSLTKRNQTAKSFDGVIRRDGQPRADTPPSLSVSAEKVATAVAALDAAEPDGEPNAHQQALLTFTEHLERQTATPAAAAAPGAAVAFAPSVRGHLARRRVEAFLNQQKAKAAAVEAPPG